MRITTVMLMVMAKAVRTLSALAGNDKIHIYSSGDIHVKLVM